MSEGAATPHADRLQPAYSPRPRHYHSLDCGPGVMITDLYRWMTELFGMHAVNWLMDEIR